MAVDGSRRVSRRCEPSAFGKAAGARAILSVVVRDDNQAYNAPDRLDDFGSLCLLV
jgi:hypothetical protein